ncbi:2-methylcitrate dehydratase [Ureibacillus sp. FSL E2-3493]|uniref:2-methylcitrate dehydratase n=1 Tax=Ureibacillus sp. FSL E2-3493 TaxID=2921367 RepID=UPI003119B3C4
MTYANFKSTVKKVNIKPKGVQEIVLEINGDELDGQLEAIAGMVDLRVNVELDAARITYRRKYNAITEQPLTQYSVSEKGIVEVKQPEQLELEGMPEEEVQIEEKEVVIDRELIDAFVMSDMAPTYEGYHKDLLDILKRRIKGESYRTLAEEFDIKTSELVEQVKLYRMQVAPLAEAWNKWKKEKGEITE